MMGSLDLAAIASLLGVSFAGTALPVRGAAIDSRRVESGDLFVATRGERVDGHDFVRAAAARGAVAALVERPVEAAIPCLVVPDTIAALTQIGAANRRAYRGPLVAITGSCGKTSVKNMCRAIFSQVGSTVATAGNYNNEIGVPLTLARLGDNTRFAVVEMGATGRGDVAHLCRLAQPTVSTVLNAMEAHLAGFGSVADVAEIKAEIFDGLEAGRVAVLHLDSPWTELWRSHITASGASVVTWSLVGAADVSARDVVDRGLEGSAFVLRIGAEERALRLPLPGRHNVANALAAAALASAAGVAIDSIAAGLEKAEGESGRMQHERLADGSLLIDDSYNANPGSVRAAIAMLAGFPGRRALVLGEMLELGDASARLHAEMGELAKERGIDCLAGVGAALAPAVAAFGRGATLYASRDELAPALPALLAKHDVILVKGSRGAAMEHVITALRATAREVTAPC